MQENRRRKSEKEIKTRERKIIGSGAEKNPSDVIKWINQCASFARLLAYIDTEGGKKSDIKEDKV